MKRTKRSKPDLILTSDWHLREDVPVCRTDDFWSAQWNKVWQIYDLQVKYDCPVVHGGDLFHHWKPSPFLIANAISMLPKKFYTVYGQHDLPQNTMSLEHKSGIQPLREAGVVHGIKGGSWGQDISEPMNVSLSSSRKIGVWHKFVWDGKELPWPGCEEMTAKQMLRKYKDYDLILTGDHHKPFVCSVMGRHIVNPGCLTRQAADYAQHKPRVYLYYADDNAVKPYYLDVEDGVVSRDHLEHKEQRDKRMEAFISRISEDWETALSFEENLKRFFSANRVRRDVVDLIYKALENENKKEDV